MEIEVPRPIAVRVMTIAHGDVVIAAARKRDPQRNPDALVDQQVVRVCCRHQSHHEPGATQPLSDAPLREQVLLNSVHVLMDGTITTFAAAYDARMRCVCTFWHKGRTG